MLKENKGISLITLIIMVIVLLILASIFISTGLDALQQTKDSKIQNEIHSLQEAISSRYASFLKNEESVSLLGALPTTRWSSVEDCWNEIGMLSSVREQSDTTQERIRKEIENDYELYIRIITKMEAKTLGAEPFDEENQYLVDYRTSSVYGPFTNEE